ncbi:elongation factor Tu [Myxococcota bacterium]|nr:elongation factor Tu [Myxococcota bacterium]
MPHVNVGTLGHEGHGKTTLTSAITSVLAAQGRAVFRPAADLDRSPDERRLGRTILPSHVEYSTEKRHYAHIDCPGHHAYARNLLTGAAQLDGAILVVSASQGVQAQTIEHIQLARQAGIEHLVVFMSKHDLPVDNDQADFVEGELRAILQAHHYPSGDTPFIRGSAQSALMEDAFGVNSIRQLIDAMDDSIPLPDRRIDRPFLMPIAEVHTIAGQGQVVTGTVRRGVIKVGEEVEVMGLNHRITAVVTGLETFNQAMAQGQAGDQIGLRLRGVTQEQCHRGQVVVAPNRYPEHNRVEAQIYVLARDEGGRTTPLTSGYRPQLHLHTADVPCALTLAEGTEMIMPGDTADLTMDLLKPIFVEKGDRFALRDGGRTIALGTITGINR